MKILLQLKGSACNGWPHVTICANDQNCWHGFVKNHEVVMVELVAQDINNVTIRLDNKQNGPQVWDTAVDSSGNILQDKYCVLESVIINGMRCPWLIDDSQYQFDDGRMELLRGWMSQNGYYMWQIPADVRSWVLENRQRRSRQNLRTSSLQYYANYFNANDSEQIAHLLQRCSDELDKLHASSGN